MEPQGVQVPLTPMGVLAPGSAHARPTARPPINMSVSYGAEWKEKRKIPKVVAYLSCSAGLTHFAQTNNGCGTAPGNQVCNHLNLKLFSPLLDLKLNLRCIESDILVGQLSAKGPSI